MHPKQPKMQERSAWSSFQGQYVSLLLIVLVFTAAGLSQTDRSETKDPLTNRRTNLGLTKEIDNPFGEHGLSSETKEYLEAVRHILRRHDLEVSLSILMPKRKYGTTRVKPKVGLRQLAMLKQFFPIVPKEAISLSFVEYDGSSPKLVVQLFEQELQNA